MSMTGTSLKPSGGWSIFSLIKESGTVDVLGLKLKGFCLLFNYAPDIYKLDYSMARDFVFSLCTPSTVGISI